MALLDHPLMGRRLLRVLRHDGGGADVLSTRLDPAQCRAACDLSRRHPVLPRWVDWHRPPLVFHWPNQRQHGAIGAVLGARGGPADVAYPGRMGLHSYHTRCLRRVRQGDSDTAQVDLSLIHISEPTRLGMISYAVFC